MLGNAILLMLASETLAARLVATALPESYQAYRWRDEAREYWTPLDQQDFNDVTLRVHGQPARGSSTHDDLDSLPDAIWQGPTVADFRGRLIGAAGHVPHEIGS